MLKTRIAAAAVAVAATALVTGAATAEAAPASPDSVQSDGFFYTYNGTWFSSFCGGWSGNSSNWGTCRNKSESLFNNGFPGGFDDVLIYWGTGMTGAWRGVCNGDALPDIGGLTFDFSGGAAGHGQSIWHNISSHRWAALGGVCA